MNKNCGEKDKTERLSPSQIPKQIAPVILIHPPFLAQSFQYFGNRFLAEHAPFLDTLHLVIADFVEKVCYSFYFESSKAVLYAGG